MATPKETAKEEPRARSRTRSAPGEKDTSEANVVHIDDIVGNRNPSTSTEEKPKRKPEEENIKRSKMCIKLLEIERIHMAWVIEDEYQLDQERQAKVKTHYLILMLIQYMQLSYDNLMKLISNIILCVY